MNVLLEDLLQFLPEPWRLLAAPSILFLAVFALGLTARRILFARFRKWAAKTDTRVDDELLAALHGPTLLWVVILAIYVATDSSHLPQALTYWSARVLLVLWIVSLTIATARLAGRLVHLFTVDKPGAAGAGTLSQVLASIVVGSLGLLLLLRALGVDITALLATFGVGGLAVALALQDTLSNFFAGFYISLAQQARVGDYVKLDSGQEGFVEDIGWRAISLRERSNNLVVIPNNKFAQSIVTNYDLPQTSCTLPIRLGVDYDTDVNHLERVVFDEVAKLNVPGLLHDPEPLLRFIPGFGDFSLDFTLILQIASTHDQFLVQTEVRKALLRRFREEGIEIPFPRRVVEKREPK